MGASRACRCKDFGIPPPIVDSLLPERTKEGIAISMVEVDNQVLEHLRIARSMLILRYMQYEAPVTK